MGITEQKSDLRSSMRVAFSHTTAAERSEWSSISSQRLRLDTHIRSAKGLLSFEPLRDEPDILPLLRALESDGKTILIAPMEGPLNYNGPIDVALIPGIAFTCEGNRLGRGKGWYDRFLNSQSVPYTIGVCFPYQIVDSLPLEKHDIQLNRVIYD